MVWQKSQLLIRATFTRRCDISHFGFGHMFGTDPIYGYLNVASSSDSGVALIFRPLYIEVSIEAGEFRAPQTFPDRSRS